MGNNDVTLASGKAINWRKPPAPNTKCRLLLNGKHYVGSLRTLAHLDRLDALSQSKFGEPVIVIQPDWNTGVAASAGTHDFDSCWDLHIPNVSWWDQQKFFRTNGFACWYRHPPKFGNHIHGFTLPPHRNADPSKDFKSAGIKVGKYVDGGISAYGEVVGSSQIYDYYHHAYGLAGEHGKNSDTSWFPADIASTIFDLSAYIDRRVKGMA